VALTPITDFEIFVRVANAGNMSAAGRDMGLSPAVVSKRISHMEERLGARLFQRTTRQLKLTETGKGFFDRVVSILADIEEAESYVSQLNEKASGLLRITVPTRFARMHIAPFLADFMQQYPDVSIEMQLNDSIVDIVGEGIDLALRIAELHDSSLMARKLAPCHNVLCATPDYLEKHGVPATPADLAKHVCVSPGYQSVWRLEGRKGVETVKPECQLRTNSDDVIHEALLSGYGIGMPYTWSVYKDLASGQLVPLLPKYRPVTSAAIYAIYPCRQFVPVKLRVFVDFLAHRYAPEPHWDQGLELSGHKGGQDNPRLRATP
jgi:DNA-binding transcriptional LysR family regulator